MDRKHDAEPGASLFTEEGTIFVGNDDRQQEEEEELVDQIRRDKELQNLVANYFGNTSFEDEHSALSTSFDSTNASHRDDSRRKLGCNEECMESAYKESCLYSSEQWQVLYQNAIREEKKLKELLDNLKTSSKTEIDLVSRKYYLAEAESRRLKLLLEQAQHLVGEKAAVLTEQETRLEKLNTQIKELQHSKDSIEGEVLLWKTSFSDLEKKLHLMEKGLNTVVLEKQIRSHYEQEISKLQLALQISSEKLNKSEKQCKDRKEQIVELEYIRDSLVAQRDDYLKEITKEREEHSQRCFKIMQELTHIKKEFLEIRDSSKVIDIFQDISTQTTQEEFQQFLSEFKEELLTTQAHSKQEVAKLQDKCEQLCKSEERLKQELKIQRDSTTQTNNKNYEFTILTLESELKRSITEQGQKRSEIEKLEKNVKEIKKNEDELKAELKSMKDRERLLSSEKYEEFLLRHHENLITGIAEQEARKHDVNTYEKVIKDLQQQEAELNENIATKKRAIEEINEANPEEKDDEINRLKERERENIKKLSESNESVGREPRRSLDREKCKDNGDVLKLNKIIKELRVMNEELKNELRKKSPRKSAESPSQEILQENVPLKQDFKHFKEENHALTEELQERDKKARRNSENNRVVERFTELERGMQVRVRVAEEKLLEAQNTIGLLQSQLTDKRNIEIKLRQELATKNENEEIVQDLVKKSEMFQEYMQEKTSHLLQNKSVQTTPVATTSISNRAHIVTKQSTPSDTKLEISALCMSTQIDTLSEQTCTKKWQAKAIFNTILEMRNNQFSVLLEENKNLKDKLKLDRESLNELTKAWNDEMENLNTALSAALQSRQELLIRITDLLSDIQKRSKMNDTLSYQLTCLNRILNNYELAAVEREQAYIKENMNLRRAMNAIFESILLKVTRCIGRTDTVTNTDY